MNVGALLQSLLWEYSHRKPDGLRNTVPCLSGFFPSDLQWLKFPLNGLRAQSRVSPAVGLLPLTSGPACLGMAFPPFLVKQLYRCDSVVISSFVRTGCTTRMWGWLLGRICHILFFRKEIKPKSPKLFMMQVWCNYDANPGSHHLIILIANESAEG